MSIKLRNMTSVYLVREGEILCLYRIGSRVANKKYVGSAGGHFEPEELNDPYACVYREMEEELGLKPEDVPDMQLRYVTYRLMGQEIRQNYYFFGEFPGGRNMSSTEGTLRWVRYGEVEDLDIPVSAKHMLLHYIREGRFTDKLYAGITEEDHTDFVELRSF